MATPIRISFAIDKNGVSGDFTQLTQSWEKSMQDATMRIGRSIDTSIGRLDSTIRKIASVAGREFSAAFKGFNEALVVSNTLMAAMLQKQEKMISNMSRIRGAAGGGGGGGAGKGAAVEGMTPEQVASLLGGLSPTGRVRTVFGPDGNQLNRVTSYAGAGARGSVTENASNAAVKVIVESLAKAAEETSVSMANAIARRAKQADYDFASNQGAVKRAKLTDAAANRYAGGKDAALEKQLDALVANITNYSKEQARQAAAMEKTNAKISSMTQTQERLGQSGQFVGRKTGLGSSGQKVVEDFYKTVDGTFIKYVQDWENLVGKVSTVRGGRGLPAGASTTVADALARVQGSGGFFSSPFRLSSSRTSTNAGGAASTISEYYRAAGLFRNAETVRINTGNNTATSTVQEMSSAWSQFKSRLVGDGSVMSQTLNAAFLPLKGIKALVGGIGDAWRSVGNTMIRVSAMFYSFERIGRLVERATLGPVEQIMNATAEGRKFQTSISSVVGGGANATAIDNAIQGMTLNTPMSLSDLRGVATEMTKIGPLANQLAFTNPTGAANAIGGFANIITQLQALNPNSTTQELAYGIGEALLGQGRALRTSAMIDPDALAQMVGRSGNKAFRGNPELLLSALQQYTSAFAPAGAVDARQNLPDVQIQHIKDQFAIALQKIGDSGMFDEVIKRLKGVATSLFDYIGSPEYMNRARGISTSLTKILDNIFDAGRSFIAGVTGTSIDKSPDAVAHGIERTFEAIAAFSNKLPGLANDIGTALSSILGKLDGFTKDLNAATTHPVGSLAVAATNTVGKTAGEAAVQNILNFRTFSGLTGGWIGRTLIPTGTPPAAPVGNFTLPTSSPSRAALLAALATGGSDSSNTALDDSLGNVGARLRLLTGTANQIGGLSDDKDKLGLITSNANNALDTLFRINPAAGEMPAGNLFANLRYQSQDAMNRLGNRMSTLSWGSTGVIPNSIVNMPQIGFLSAQRSNLAAQVGTALDAATKDIVKQVAEYGASVADAVKGQGTAVQAHFLGQVVSGNTSVAQRARAGLAGLGINVDASQMGLAGIPGYLQAGTIDDLTKARLGSIQQFGGYLSPNMSIDQIMAMSQTMGRSTFFGGPGRDAAQIQAVQTSLSMAQDAYTTAQAKLAGDPTNPQSQANVLQLAQAISELTQKLEELKNKSNETAEAFMTFGDNVQHHIGDTLGNVFESLITKTNNLKQIVQQLAQSILHDFTQMMGQQITNAAFSELQGAMGASDQPGHISGGNIVGLLLGLAGKIVGVNTGNGNTPSGFGIGAEGPINPAAYGGIVAGFADGGIARSPMINVIGERADRVPEAVVPMFGGHIPLRRDSRGNIFAALPGGRRISAKMFSGGGVAAGGFGSGAEIGSMVGGGGTDTESGSGGIVIHTHTYLDGEEIASRTYKKNRQALVNDVIHESRPGGKVRRAMSMPR